MVHMNECIIFFLIFFFFFFFFLFRSTFEHVSRFDPAVREKLLNFVTNSMIELGKTNIPSPPFAFLGSDPIDKLGQ
jgi:hypothetical protein